MGQWQLVVTFPDRCNEDRQVCSLGPGLSILSELGYAASFPCFCGHRLSCSFLLIQFSVLFYLLPFPILCLCLPSGPGLRAHFSLGYDPGAPHCRPKSKPPTLSSRSSVSDPGPSWSVLRFLFLPPYPYFPSSDHQVFSLSCDQWVRQGQPAYETCLRWPHHPPPVICEILPCRIHP